jgi:hypothetical protein
VGRRLQARSCPVCRPCLWVLGAPPAIAYITHTKSDVDLGCLGLGAGLLSRRSANEMLAVSPK